MALLSGPRGARADQLGSLLAPDAGAPHPNPPGPVVAVVPDPSNESRGAVGGEGHGVALECGPRGARADQLGSLLGPHAAAPRPDPPGPRVAVVPEPSDEGRVAVGGEGHGRALGSDPHGTRADQLGSLLGPDGAAPSPDPHGPRGIVVSEPSDEGRVPVGGEGHGNALGSVSHGTRADQLGSLLGPAAAAPPPAPHGPRGTRVREPSDVGRRAVGGAGPA